MVRRRLGRHVGERGDFGERLGPGGFTGGQFRILLQQRLVLDFHQRFVLFEQLLHRLRALLFFGGERLVDRGPVRLRQFFEVGRNGEVAERLGQTLQARLQRFDFALRRFDPALVLLAFHARADGDETIFRRDPLLVIVSRF